MSAFILEATRAEVAVCRERCRTSFSTEGWEPAMSIMACWNYHTAVQQLHDAERRLRLLEGSGQ